MMALGGIQGESVNSLESFGTAHAVLSEMRDWFELIIIKFIAIPSLNKQLSGTELLVSALYFNNNNNNNLC